MEGDFFNPFQMLTNYISIHSLRMEGDKYVSSDAFSASHISIHSLRMEGDQRRYGHRRTYTTISIHSLRMEGDHRNACLILRKLHFNPLPPHGGRPELTYTAVNTIYISIHSLRMEGDVSVL